MFFNYGYKVSKILNNAEKERYNLAHPYVGSEHLLLSILKYDEACIKAFKKFNVSYDIFKDALIKTVGSASKKQEINLYTPLLKRIIANATDTAIEEKKEVSSKDLILALLEESEGIAFRILLSLDVDPDLLYKELKSVSNENKLLSLDIGINLNKSVNMNEKIIGRDDEINQIIEILLRKKKNNPILVGKAGVGKTAIVEELARRINAGKVPALISNYQIISLEMAFLVAGTKYRGEFEERLTKLVTEIKENKNIILFIDEIHNIATAGGSEGAINAADILKPYMARGDIKIIGATTINEYEKYIIKDKALERRFERVLVEEPSFEETINLLIKIKKEYENYHHIIIDDDIIKFLVSKTDELINNKNNPDKSIELLDTVCSHVKLKNLSNIHSQKELAVLKSECLKQKDYEKASFYLKEQLKLNKDNKVDKITKADVLEVINSRCNIPTINDYYKLENRINNNKLLEIINYKYNNIDELYSILLVDINNELLDIIIKNYNSKSKAIVIDLKEYDNKNKLIGVSAGYIGYEDNYALKDIINYPYSLVVFKNVDKANNSIKQLIHKIVKEGTITSGRGDILNFTKSLIIGTKSLDKKNKIGFNQNYTNSDDYGFTKVFCDDNIMA